MKIKFQKLVSNLLLSVITVNFMIFLFLVISLIFMCKKKGKALLVTIIECAHFGSSVLSNNIDRK